MSTTRRLALTAAAIALVAGPAALNATAGAATSSPLAPAPTATSTTAPSTSAADIAFSRDEERLARDLYRAFADRYDVAIFEHIASSEQRHFDAIGRLLSRYGVADPAAKAKAGSYSDPVLQKLYDGWLAQGSASVEAAYAVGVALEMRDIADLERMIAAKPGADVARVFELLVNGSRHHLAAFTAAVRGDGSAAAMGDCPQTGAVGQGQGRGMGARMGTALGSGMGSGGGQGAGLGTGRNQ